MAAIETFRPYIQAELPACPLITIDASIREGCRALARDTWLIRSESVDYAFDQIQAYDLTVPTGHEIIAVKSVILDNAVELRHTTDSARLRSIPAYGAPQHYWFERGQLWLYPIPNASFTLTSETVIRPDLTTLTVDDQFSNYFDAIRSWVLSRLKRITGQPWTDLPGSELNHALYKRLISGHRTDRDLSGGPNVRRVATNFY